MVVQRGQPEERGEEGEGRGGEGSGREGADGWARLVRPPRVKAKHVRYPNSREIAER